jgi:hypothetical protein
LHNLILQLLAEGLARKADFKASELFARDLHIASLAATVGPVPDLIIGNRRLEIVENTARSFVIDQAALLEAHQRVIVELENQKLTSFASIMDPALLAYRLLIDYASQDSASRDPDGVIRDFSNGLKLSALQAMVRGKWSFAESLLLQAAASDPSNLEVSNEVGIYLLRRLVRRWCRPDDSLTPGVSSQDFMWSDYDLQTYWKSDRELPEGLRGTREAREAWIEAREFWRAENEGVVDETAWATARKAWNLLVKDEKLDIIDPWFMRWIKTSQGMLRGNWRVEVWKRLATIIVCTSSPDPDDLKLLSNSNVHRPDLTESTLIGELVKLFGAWERSFRMTREVSRLQREWSGWFEPLEVLWWLGYRREAHTLALEARGFVAEKPVMDRMALIRQWDPAYETLEFLGYDEDQGPIEELVNYGSPSDDNDNRVELDYPTALLNRPMNI